MSADAEGFAPGRLWSLWDIMIHFDVRLLILRMRHIEDFEELLSTGAPIGGSPPVDGSALTMRLTPSNSPNERLSADGRKWLWAHIGPLQVELSPLALTVAQTEVQHIWNNAHIWTAKEMAGRLKEFRLKLTNELNDRFFVYLTPEEAHYFRETQPFGKETIGAFHSSEVDIGEASKCFAIGRNTACVFHCMRILETGLRVMAADVGIAFDVQNWQNVIDQIESEVKKIGKTLPSGATKSQRLQQLSEAAVQFTYFKDAWRNHVSHNRSRYDANQALSIFNHTKEFMGALAKWLQE
ncbi:hypothetical protein CU048_09270 [Beijerinckiaceae bacterium]|nr:hypothetical protein CU048_09270 [Beijerinckiaceae bacterium]